MANAEIKLEYPYSEIWKKGYIVVNPEGRRTLILFNSSDDRTSTQYARYLLAVKLGRFLNDDEQVDHKDNDKTNDALGNLQILSKQENIAATDCGRNTNRIKELTTRLFPPSTPTLFAITTNSNFPRPDGLA